MAHLLPVAILTDSYKAGHPEQYPEAKRMVAYGEFRAPYRGAKDDQRFVFFGMRYLVETYLERRWTEEEVERAAQFYLTHNAAYTAFPFPKQLFLKFIRENNGYFPVRVQALPEGTCAHIHTPVYQITAEGEYSRLVTFLETILTHVWYPSTVATLSRRTRDLVEKAFAESVDDEDAWMVDFKLHDFGFRGCTSVEQSIVGGCAHLLSFLGSDTMSAAYYAQFHLNRGQPVAQSIPATEHSVMTAWPSEREAILNMIHRYGAGTFACVMDSYDYQGALDKVLPAIAAEKTAKGGFMVLRPDSGDPVDVVLAGLRAAEKCFGSVTNKKGYRKVSGAGVIQGDGINFEMVAAILAAVHKEKFSAASVTFGMGGGLLQKVDRDTMSFATKLSHIEEPSGAKRDVMKRPKTDSGKISFPGVLSVRRVNGIPTVFPAASADTAVHAAGELLEVVYDHGPVKGRVWPTFAELRQRVKEQWTHLPRVHDPVSAELHAKVKHWLTEHHIPQ